MYVVEYVDEEGNASFVGVVNKPKDFESYEGGVAFPMLINPTSSLIAQVVSCDSSYYTITSLDIDGRKYKIPEVKAIEELDELLNIFEQGSSSFSDDVAKVIVDKLESVKEIIRTEWMLRNS